MEDQEDEEAALWVIRHMDGSVDSAAFSRWLSAAPGRRARFDALRATMMDSAVTEGARLHASRTEAPGMPPQPRHARRGSKTAKARQGKATSPARRIALTALAASLVAILALSWPHLRFAMTPTQSYETTAGQIRDITIADGSSITLNGASRIRVKIGADRREVMLDSGEALFEVRHDPSQPFVVSAGAARATVLGTRFDLALNGQQIDLEVEDGLVRFEPASSTHGAGAVLVPAAHRSAFVNGKVSAPARYPVAAAEWRTGWLEVADMPLAQIIPRLSRWSAKPIIVRDPALLGKRVAGRFHLSQPDIVLDNLAVLYGFRVRNTDQAYIVDVP